MEYENHRATSDSLASLERIAGNNFSRLQSLFKGEVSHAENQIKSTAHEFARDLTGYVLLRIAYGLGIAAIMLGFFLELSVRFGYSPYLGLMLGGGVTILIASPLSRRRFSESGPSA